jgi:hypothetical protein
LYSPAILRRASSTDPQDAVRCGSDPGSVPGDVSGFDRVPAISRTLVTGARLQ